MDQGVFGTGLEGDIDGSEFIEEPIMEPIPLMLSEEMQQRINETAPLTDTRKLVQIVETAETQEALPPTNVQLEDTRKQHVAVRAVVPSSEWGQELTDDLSFGQQLESDTPVQDSADDSVADGAGESASVTESAPSTDAAEAAEIIWRHQVTSRFRREKEFMLEYPNGNIFKFNADEEGPAIPVQYCAEAKKWSWDVLAFDNNPLWFNQTWFEQQHNNGMRGTRTMSYMKTGNPEQFVKIQGPQSNIRKRQRETDEMIYQIELTGSTYTAGAKNNCKGAKMQVRNPSGLLFLDPGNAPDIVHELIDHVCRENALEAFQQKVVGDAFNQITDISLIRMPTANDIIPMGIVLYYSIMIPRSYLFDLERVHHLMTTNGVHTSCKITWAKRGFPTLEINGLYGAQQTLKMSQIGNVEFHSGLKADQLRDYTVDQTAARIIQYQTEAGRAISLICKHWKDLAVYETDENLRDTRHKSFDVAMSRRRRRSTYDIIHFPADIADAQE